MPENNQKNHSTISHTISIAAILKIVAVILGLYLLFIIRDIVLLVVISALLASAMNPLVEWLYRRLRFPRGLTVTLVYFLFIGVVGVVFALLVPIMISEFKDLASNFSGFREKFDTQSSALFGLFERFGLSNFLQSVGSSLTDFTSGIFEKTLGLFSGIFQIITVLVISFYLVSQQDALKDFLKTLTPSDYHPLINNVAIRGQSRLGSWLLGQLALMASIFAMMYLALSVLGVKYALSLALLAGLLEIIPYIGPIVSTIPGVFIAFLQSPVLALIVLVVYWAVQQLEGYLLVPRIIGKSIGANPLVVLIAVLVGFNLAGIVGVLISAPLVAVGTVVIEEYRDYRKSSGSGKNS